MLIHYSNGKRAVLEPRRTRRSALLEVVSNSVAGNDRIERADLVAAVEQAVDGILIADITGKIQYVNPAFTAMTGYSSEDAVGEYPRILQSGRHPVAFYSELWNTIRSGRTWRGEVINRRKDGTLYTEEMRITPVRSEQGEIVSYIAIKRDVTEQQAAEEEQRFLAAIVETSGDAIVACSPMGIILTWNRGAETILGYSSEEAVGKHLPDLIALEQHSAVLHITEIVSKCDAISQHEAFCLHKEGGRIPVSATGSPIRNRAGDVAAVSVILRDVSERHKAQEALQAGEARYRMLAHTLASVGECVRITDTDDRIQYVNDALLWTYGYREDELIGQHVDILSSAGRLIPTLDEIRSAERGGISRGELWNRTKDGRDFPVSLTTSPVYDDDGRQVAVVGISLDITERKQAEQALQDSEEKFRQLAESMREVSWMMDAGATKILYVSPAYETIWGRTCESLYSNSHSWINSIHPEDRPSAGEIFFRQAQGEVIDNEYRIVQPSGAIRWIRDRAFPVRDRAGQVIRLGGIAEDTTERKFSEIRLAHQALYDELTDLPNRRLFRERLTAAITECGTERSGAVFFVDLDQFKLVNDTLGHSAGDSVLKEAAQRLRAACEESDTLARFGGDEFTLVATGLDGPESAQQYGEKLIRSLDPPFRLGDREVFIGASIGISLFPENGTDPYLLKTNASLAMRDAKRAGRNRTRLFIPAFADEARTRLDIETRLRKALDLSEFQVHFQPQFPCGKSRPSRFEALIRWYPSDGPPVPPVNFIPVAEQNGLIIPIGTWVIHEACRRCAEWQNTNLSGTGVAVNVSAPQFASPGFVENVIQTLEATGLAPRLLELELTESVFIQNVDASAVTLARLRNHGVTIALDDFGTGYSSLSYLQKLPLDALKIDQGFLRETESRPHGAAVLRCVVEMAHALGLRVVGEGVETTDQLDLLNSLGCDEFQGFLLGMPSFDVSTRPAANGIEPQGVGWVPAIDGETAEDPRDDNLSLLTQPGFGM